MCSVQTEQIDFLVYGQDRVRFSSRTLEAACRAALVDAEPSVVELSRDTVDALLAQSLFRLDQGKLRFGSKLTYIDHGTMGQLLEAAQRAAEVYVRVLASEQHSLRALVPLFVLEGREAQWDEVAHLLVAGLIIDLGLRREMLSSEMIDEQPNDYWVWAFAGGTGSENSFGVQMWATEDGQRAAFARLWHKHSRRPSELKIDSRDVSLLRDIFKQSGALAWTGEKQQRALKLAFYKLLTRTGGAYALKIPVLHGEPGRRICSEVLRISRAIFREAVVPSMEFSEGIFRETGFAEVTGQHKHAFARLLLECSIERVVTGDLVPPFPAVAQHNWATWLTFDECMDDLQMLVQK